MLSLGHSEPLSEFRVHSLAFSSRPWPTPSCDSLYRLKPCSGLGTVEGSYSDTVTPVPVYEVSTMWSTLQTKAFTGPAGTVQVGWNRRPTVSHTRTNRCPLKEMVITGGRCMLHNTGSSAMEHPHSRNQEYNVSLTHSFPQLFSACPSCQCRGTSA